MSTNLTEERNEAERFDEKHTPLPALTPEEEAAARQCWRTPPELWAGIMRYWNPQIDIAANSDNHLCSLWCGPDHEDEDKRDGLAVPFSSYSSAKSLYCNPGFSNLGPWCRHVRQETNAGFPCGVVMAMVAPSTEWWRDWAMVADEIVLLTPRVNFLPPPGVKPSTNNHDNALLIYRHGPPRLGHASPRVTTWQWCEPKRKSRKEKAA